MTNSTSTIPAGTRVCHRTFGLGKVLPAPTKGRGEALVEFESGAVSIVAAQDFVAIPPEGFKPVFDDDGLAYYDGPTVMAGDVVITRNWQPEEGMIFWLSPSDRKRSDDYFTTGEIRTLIGALQDLLNETDRK
ncbi:hypothetical protein [Sinomonas humi]|uniref:Uncharacterized protein n=1 Tax=Sinomonas humi TaxID=1338436 RepID=A0A0B2AA36_9MICC|nr:hypothetical protein [Sinomonas humi]KHL00424.1 hypothetical protein LK10_19625 [Sinomonas humi]